jgi:N-acetylglucosaminyl-diphospho-decaprenol L-rhamnosyltransferase
MPDVGIVIVTCNSGEHIGACLAAASRTGAEIVVVDNASTDRTLSEAEQPGVRVIANSENRGFAAAVNQGIRAVATPYVLLLNPDAVLETGLEALRACCERPDAAGAGGLLLDERGAPQRGFMVRRFPTPWALAFEVLLLNRVWPRNPLNWHYRCLDLDFTKEQEVDQPAGAFLMIRRDVWTRVGGFDEGFHPLWFEDVDFALRARAVGFRMFFTPGAVAKHTGGHSISNMPVEIRAVYWYGSFLRYSARHFRPWTTRMLCLAVIAGSIARMVVGSTVQCSLKPIAAYVRVVGLAGRLLVSRKGGTALLSFP